MKSERGLTLIELIIALAVMAILAAVAIPTYTGYVQKSRRSDAMTVLSQLQVKEEQYRLKNPTYTNLLSTLGIDTTSTSGYYTISIPSHNAGDFTATAAPIGAQASDDCGTFAINSDGPDTTGSYASNACWRR